MECVCLGDVYEEDVKDLVECINLKNPLSEGYDRNYEFFKNLNLGGLYELFSSILNSLKLNYFFTSRPTKLEYDSSCREVFKGVKNMFSQKKRKLTFNLGPSGLRTPTKCGLSSCFDFFVNDRLVTVVSAYEGCNIRVTTMPTASDFVLNKNPVNGLEFDVCKNVGVKSFVVVTGRESCITTLSVNDFFGFGFEVFLGFSDNSVCFLRVNTNFGFEKGTEDSYNCVNISGFVYLDDTATFSKFSPNRDLVLVSTKKSLYLLEKSGFDLEYERLCEFKGSLVCADFLNDFEIMVLEDNHVLTVYKKYNLMYNKYIKYNLKPLLYLMGSKSGLGGVNSGTKVTPSPKFGSSKDKNSEKLSGKFVKDYQGNVYLMIKNVNLIKLTWNESFIPYSNTVVLQEPSNLSSLASLDKTTQKMVYNFNVESNLAIVTFTGSSLVHLYSLTSFKELFQLRPPNPGYLPKFVSTSSASNSCFVTVLWSYQSNFDSKLDSNYQQIFERDLRHPDILRSYKVKSSLTKDMSSQTYEPYQAYKDLPNYGLSTLQVDPRYKRVPKLSSLYPKVNNLRTRYNEYTKFDDSFLNRRNIFGRSLSDHSVRMPQETIYSIDEFIRNRRR